MFAVRCIRARLALMFMALAILVGALTLVAKPANATHYTCSHQTSYWAYAGWLHAMTDQWNDPFYGHQHQYRNVRQSDGFTTFRIWICNAA